MKYPPYSLWEPMKRVNEVREASINYDHSWDYTEDEEEIDPIYDEELQPTSYMMERAAKEKKDKEREKKKQARKQQNESL